MQIFFKTCERKNGKKFLVAISQCRNFSSTRYDNFSAGDIVLPLKLTKLLHELPPSQQSDLGEILSLTIKSH